MSKDGRNHLTELEQLVLLAVLRTRPAYGASIKRDLEANAGRSLSVATIFVALARLERRGLVSSAMGEPTDVRGGRSKRCFTVRESGVVALQESFKTLWGLWDGVDTSLDPRKT